MPNISDFRARRGLGRRSARWLATLGAFLFPAAASDAALELVQSFPVGAEALHDPSLREAHEVWLEMIRDARESVDLAHFYASNREGSRLEEVVRALEEAADRGVSVRFLAEASFHETYPATLDRLGSRVGIDVRLLDLRETLGGVLHAKFMVVDARTLFVGSQNFDWRALEHIQELGARVESDPLAADFLRLFDADWSRAGGAPEPWVATGATPSPVDLEYAGEEVRAAAVFSPRDGLVPELAWDLPALLERLDGARRSVRVQLLSYRASDRDGTYWPEIENSLRAAAARGVRVEMLLSHWNQREGSIEGLQSLQCLPGIEVKLLTPPPDPGGFIPYARVIHAKYLVVDGERAWLGTSNWSRDYFYSSRNVGLLLDGTAVAGDLEAYFERGWRSPWAETVRPGHEYPAPRVGE